MPVPGDSRESPAGQRATPTHRSNSFTVADDFNRLNISADVTYYSDWKGQHSIKAGVLVRALRQRRQHRPAGAERDPRLECVARDARRPSVRGTYGYYDDSPVVHRRRHQLEQHRPVHSGFVDAEQPADAELRRAHRARRDPVVPAGESRASSSAGATSWRRASDSPTTCMGNSKWKAYGSWGMFYDIFKLELPRGSFGADRWISYYWTMDTFNWPSINCDGKPGSGCPGTFIEQVDFRHVVERARSGARRAGSQAVSRAGVDARSRSRAERHDVARRALLAQVAESHDRGRRASRCPASARCSTSSTSARVSGRTSSARSIRRSRCRCATTTGSSPPAQRPREPLVDEHEPAVQPSLRQLLGPRELGRERPHAARTSTGSSTASTCRSTRAGKPTYGRLQTDRPVVFELQGTYELPWGTGIGTNFFAGSGTPLQDQATIQGVPVLYNGRGNLGPHGRAQSAPT